jgi:hypothetical protein
MKTWEQYCRGEKKKKTRIPPFFIHSPEMCWPRCRFSRPSLNQSETNYKSISWIIIHEKYKSRNQAIYSNMQTKANYESHTHTHTLERLFSDWTNSERLFSKVPSRPTERVYMQHSSQCGNKGFPIAQNSMKELKKKTSCQLFMNMHFTNELISAPPKNLWWMLIMVKAANNANEKEKPTKNRNRRNSFAQQQKLHHSGRSPQQLHACWWFFFSSDVPSGTQPANYGQCR